MICKNDITSIKADIGENIGQKIIVKGSLGRSKSFEKEATIEKTYPNIFIVKYDDNERNVTYSYTDVLTRTIEMQVFNGTDYTPLMPDVVEVKRAVKTPADLPFTVATGSVSKNIPTNMTIRKLNGINFTAEKRIFFSFICSFI